MAKSSIEINLQYDMALQQAETLQKIASELRQKATGKIDKSLSALSHEWKSDNADIYLQKCNTVKIQITETAKRLDKIASTIKKVAKTTYDTEMKALELANQRNYK